MTIIMMILPSYFFLHLLESPAIIYEFKEIIVRNWNRLRLKYFFGPDKKKCSLLSTLLMGFLPYKLN